MSADFWIFLLALAAAIFGVYAAGKRKPPAWALIVIGLAYAFCGVYAVLVAWLTGAGHIFPGTQLSPGLMSFHSAEVVRSGATSYDPAWLFVALVPPLLLFAFKRAVRPLLAVLAASAVFVVLFFVFEGRAEKDPIAYTIARGPSEDAYLTVIPTEDGSRLLISAGERTASFLEVLHVHDAGGRAPSMRLDWTSDGQVLVIRITKERLPAFAITRDGEVTGELPAKANEWPKEQGDYVSPRIKRKFSHARKEVARLIKAHGDIYAPVR